MKVNAILILVILSISSCQLKGQEKDCVVEPSRVQKVDAKEAIIIDVRTPQEYNAGHLKDALLIEVTASDFEEKIKNLDKNKQYYVYCRSGRRSARAQAIMQDLGFEKVCNVEGGILRMQEEGMELVR